MGFSSCKKDDKNCNSKDKSERNSDRHDSDKTMTLEPIVVHARPERESNDFRNGNSRREKEGRPPNPHNSCDMLTHYVVGNGKTKTLRDYNLLERVKYLVKKPNALGKMNGHSVHGDFLTQILNGNKHFKNTYDFGEGNHVSQGMWAIGSATLEGKFVGGAKKYREKEERSTITYFRLRGLITYSFRDTFKDPVDIFNVLEKDIEFGVPFDIIDTWEEEIDISISESEYMRFNRL